MVIRYLNHSKHSKQTVGKESMDASTHKTLQLTVGKE